ncbi:MAG: DUF58 domain-containing protein [Phycisphaeraceae bacterium]|nr:DUF58 domain-containing protein [Phycisphaeraceae bacterium]MBX3406147.1 DUF58 domain-containing protein [Phycisphaeraceae bacterium]
MTPAELARQVRLLELSTRRRVTEVFAGEYSSAFKGRGMEFADVREYQPGDDVRFIDWNVTARSGRPFIKRFVEERELTVMLAVDVSGSLAFGTSGPTDHAAHTSPHRPDEPAWSVLAEGSKRALAAKVCALLAFAAVRAGDRVGLCAFTDRVELSVPARKGSRHALRLVRELLALDATGRGTNPAAAADLLRRTLHRRSLVFFVSDFLAPGASGEASFERALRRIAGGGRAARGHDVVAAAIRDRRDAELVNAGLVRLRDPETGREAVIDTSSSRVRDAYSAAYSRADSALDRAIAGAGLRALRARVTLWTHDEPVHELVGLFHRRER